MNRPTAYVGIHADVYGGMTDIGRMIRDAWVFGLLPEGEGFAGKSAGDLQNLFEAVHKAWEPHGQLPSRLPPELANRLLDQFSAAEIHDLVTAVARSLEGPEESRLCQPV